MKNGEYHGKPFVVVDKKQAKLFVFDSGGRILADTSVLCGLAVGDLTTPGVGDLELSRIPPKDRTTAAGKFLLRSGMDMHGGKVLWIDFDSGFAIHTVPEGKANELRLRKLQSIHPKERRVTLGCINVTKEFYQTILSPLFDKASGYIFIIPETMPADSFFGFTAQSHT